MRHGRLLHRQPAVEFGFGLVKQGVEFGGTAVDPNGAWQFGPESAEVFVAFGDVEDVADGFGVFLSVERLCRSRFAAAPVWPAHTVFGRAAGNPGIWSPVRR